MGWMPESKDCEIVIDPEPKHKSIRSASLYIPCYSNGACCAPTEFLCRHKHGSAYQYCGGFRGSYYSFRSDHPNQDYRNCSYLISHDLMCSCEDKDINEKLKQSAYYGEIEGEKERKAFEEAEAVEKERISKKYCGKVIDGKIQLEKKPKYVKIKLPTVKKGDPEWIVKENQDIRVGEFLWYDHHYGPRMYYSSPAGMFKGIVLGDPCIGWVVEYAPKKGILRYIARESFYIFQIEENYV